MLGHNEIIVEMKQYKDQQTFRTANLDKGAGEIMLKREKMQRQIKVFNNTVH